MGVSWNRGTPKSSILDWDFPVQSLHFGVPPWLWKPPNRCGMLWRTQQLLDGSFAPDRACWRQDSMVRTADGYSERHPTSKTWLSLDSRPLFIAKKNNQVKRIKLIKHQQKTQTHKTTHLTQLCNPTECCGFRAVGTLQEMPSSGGVRFVMLIPPDHRSRNLKQWRNDDRSWLKTKKHVGVSINGGTPRSSILDWDFPSQTIPLLGYPYFRKPPYG